MDLIYHSLNKSNRVRSPFDSAIQDIIKDKTIKVACPYIGINYFKSIIIDGCKDWELLTDINALMNSQQHKIMAENTLHFLNDYHKKIRHLSGLHAKVIISEGRALIGSANFTNTGITENCEMSVAITDLDKIEELDVWYNAWWQYANELKPELFSNSSEQVGNREYTRNTIYYIPPQKLIKTYYEQTNVKNQINEEKDEEYLINFLKHWNNKKFMEYFFDLAQHIIEKYHINEYDERLCITFREERYKIPIIIGQRYILVPYWSTETIGLIMPFGYNKENAYLDGFYKEELFKIRQRNNASWVYYKKEKERKFNETTIMEWENAIENELLRSKKSSYRKYHQAILYKFIVDEMYRIKVMEEIY